MKKKNQNDTKRIHAKSIVNGEQSLEDLPEPYLLLYDGLIGDNMAKAINILAIKKGYKIVTYAASGGYDLHACMVKERSSSELQHE